MFCKNCGAQLPDYAKFCDKCGAQLPEANAAATNPAEPDKANANPVNTNPANNVPNPPKKKSKIGLIIGGICLGAVLLLGLGIGGIYFLFTHVTKNVSEIANRDSSSISGSDSYTSQEGGSYSSDNDQDNDESSSFNDNQESYEDSYDNSQESESNSYEEDVEEDEDEDYYEGEDEDDYEEEQDDNYAYSPEDALNKYVYFFVEAVNTGNYDDAEYCMKINSEIYNQQKKVSSHLYNKNIEENVEWCNVKKVKYIDDYTAKVTSDEGITAYYDDGSSKLIKQSYTYTCVLEDGVWLITKMK